MTTSGALRSRSGVISQSLFALGPLTRGVFWEITAIPDIRRQSETLALHLSHLLHEPAPRWTGRSPTPETLEYQRPWSRSDGSVASGSQAA